MKYGNAGQEPAKGAGAGRVNPMPLTPRETEVVDLLAKGLGYKEIADRLAVSTYTVASHLAHVRDKWGVHNIAGILGRNSAVPLDGEAG